MSRVLLVEDEDGLAEGLVFNLRNVGYDVDHVVSGEEALGVLERQEYDLVLLDVALPGMTGLDVTRHLRRGGATIPIVMVSARDRTGDAIAGIDAGADDYVTKPFDLDELLARIRANLRRQVWNRAVPRSDPSPDGVQFGAWWVDFATFEAVCEGQETIGLTAREVGMLKLFASRPGEVVSRECFLEEVWGLPGSLETRTVDNYIRKLRLALETDPSNPRHIQSVRGAGYRFVPDP